RNQATLSRTGPLETRWKSSRTSVASPIAVNALTSSGSATLTMRDGPTSSGDSGMSSAGQALRSAAITYDQSTTGSLSPSSRVNHATGRAAASSDSRHMPSNVVLPEPTGAATSVSLVPGPVRL